MIHAWRLLNFKSIKDQMEQLILGDLTIFAGANSSGKSSVIQSILLITQTLVTRENATLQLNGELVSLGQVDDIWYNGELPGEDTSKRISIEMIIDNIAYGYGSLYLLLEFEPIAPTKVKLAYAHYASQDGSGEYEDSIQISSKESRYLIEQISESLDSHIHHELSNKGMSKIAPLNVAEVRIEDFYPRALLIEAQTMTRVVDWPIALAYPLENEFTSSELADSIPKEFLPIIDHAILTLKLPSIENYRSRRSSSLILKIYKEWFSELTARKVEELREYFRQQLPGLVVSVQQWHTIRLFEAIEMTLTEHFSRRIRYLSANRIPPTMLFDLNAPSVWSEVGINGANVAAALKEYGDKIITYWDPNLRKISDVPLSHAVLIWLQFFQIIERIETEDRGKLGTLLKVYATGVAKELDLTSVGFGTSQILPIIVQGLLTPPGYLFIVEQPEVHLRPHVQSQLAYFFFALTKVGVQCIVETHSEYIVNQLRILIAKGHPELRKRVKIYFAERDAQTGTRFEEVRLTSSGKIKNWPKGFMDEGTKLAQEILLAATEEV